MNLFTFSLKYPDLASYEFLSWFNFPEHEIQEGTIIARVKMPQSALQLAYVKEVHEILWTCNDPEHLSDLDPSVFEDAIKGTFAAKKVGKSRFSEKELGSLIWKNRKDPKVNLSSPDSTITFFFLDRKVHIVRLLGRNREDFESRRPHKRPAYIPISLHPKLARCMINLTGARKGCIFDTCCGIGGILIEARCLGLQAIGYDIDQIMLKRAKIALDHYRIDGYRLVQKDATTLQRRMRYIVSDLPYGRNTKLDKTFYASYMAMLERTLGSCAVVSIPDTLSYKPLLPDTLKITAEFQIYIHKSLTKRILIIQPIR